MRMRSRIVAASFAALLLGAGPRPAPAAERVTTVAVFPVENLSGVGIPEDAIRQFFIDRLAAEGITVVGNAALGSFMAQHRVRYAAGIDAETATALRRETGADGVLIASMELSSDALPPKVAMNVRLISLKDIPAVVWAADAGLSGDDAPGLLGLGLVNDYQKVLTRALNGSARSLAAFMKTGAAEGDARSARKFRPKTAYRSLDIEPRATYSVAVVPFYNLSDRRNAGEILALLFIRHLSSFGQMRVIDTGVTRRQLLDARIIMDDGLSLSDADTIAALIDADFVLCGRVLRYADYEGPAGTAKVEFSAVLIEKKSRKVVWSSDSYNDGGDGVRFFERGRSKTAHAMATQMVRLTTQMIVGKSR